MRSPRRLSSSTTNVWRSSQLLSDPDFERQDRSPTTVAAYRGRIDKHILPALGNVRVRELTVGLVDRHLRAVEARHGAAMAKQTKTVLGQVIGLAVRHDALIQNPVREASPISTMPKNPPRAFTARQAAQLMAALTYDDQAVARDLPALVATMLASGLRLGEACAIFWRSMDLEAGTLKVEATVVRIKGKGLLRKTTKTTERAVEPFGSELVCPDAAGTRRGRLHGRGHPRISDLNGQAPGPVEHCGRPA